MVGVGVGVEVGVGVVAAPHEAHLRVRRRVDPPGRYGARIWLGFGFGFGFGLGVGVGVGLDAPGR